MHPSTKHCKRTHRHPRILPFPSSNYHKHSASLQNLHSTRTPSERATQLKAFLTAFGLAKTVLQLLAPLSSTSAPPLASRIQKHISHIHTPPLLFVISLRVPPSHRDCSMAWEHKHKHNIPLLPFHFPLYLSSSPCTSSNSFARIHLHPLPLNLQ